MAATGTSPNPASRLKMNKDQFIGNMYGKVLVVSLSHKDKKYNRFYNCECSCGNKIVVMDASLKRPRKGCKLCSQTKHMMWGTRIYAVWNGMKGRCLNPRNKNFNHYGGRGITISKEWMTFDGFFKDMGLPEKGYSLDRIDNNGPYSKSNCKWSTRSEQASNTRNSRLFTIDGETKCLKQWCRSKKVKYHVVMHKLKKGMSIHDALLKTNHE